MFKRMLAAFGVGGPSVDTVLDTPAVMPGQPVRGRVRIQGGSNDAVIDQIALSLVTRAELEHGDHERAGVAEFHRVVVQQGVRVQANQPLDIPFQFDVPWETPITAVGSSPLPGMTVGVRTDLVISGAPDKGDLDQLAVTPLPSQDRVLDAFGQLGFQFRSADVEVGRLHGVPQQLGFYQEIEFFPPAQHAGRVAEVELTFIATPHELFVVLEADKRGGFLRAGGDAFGHFRMTHQEAETADWAPVVDGWLAQVAQGRAANPAFGGHNAAFGQQQGYPGQHGHPGQRGHRRGPGMGAVVGGAAAGLVGGMIIGDMMGDMGGDDDGGGDFEE